MTASTHRVAIVWRGETASPPPERLAPVIDALGQHGIEASAVAWSEERAEAARAALLACDGALVWVDPLTQGQDRRQLDAVLREVARQGVWVSGHPDVIAKMGVKAVLARTKDLGWGSDAHAYETAAAFRDAFPARLAADGVRVLKQNRGNGNQGVFRVALRDAARPVGPDSLVEVIEARADRLEPPARLADFMERCEGYLAGGGMLIDQAYQARVGEGLVRCYMGRDRVIGFSEQFPRSRTLDDPAAATFGMARDKTMHAADAPRFQGLRRRMETEWTPGLQRLLDIQTGDLPALWDADFLRGEPSADGEERFVLCEINASCVTPFPPATPGLLAAVVRDSLGQRRAGGAQASQPRSPAGAGARGASS